MDLNQLKELMATDKGLRITAAYYLLLKEMGYNEDEIIEAAEELSFILNKTMDDITMMMGNNDIREEFGIKRYWIQRFTKNGENTKSDIVGDGYDFIEMYEVFFNLLEENKDKVAGYQMYITDRGNDIAFEVMKYYDYLPMYEESDKTNEYEEISINLPKALLSYFEEVNHLPTVEELRGLNNSPKSSTDE